jgi:hypothetical protein
MMRTGHFRLSLSSRERAACFSSPLRLFLFACIILSAALLLSTTVSPGIAESARIAENRGSVESAGAAGVPGLPHEALLGQDKTETEICELADAVLATEMDLERFYLEYRLNGTVEPRWRRWRYFLGQSASAGLFVASDTTNLVAFSRSFSTPVGNSVLRKSYAAGIVGSVIGASSDCVELASNARLACKNRFSGTHPASAVSQVKEKLSTIDRLLDERDRLLSTFPDGKVKEMNMVEAQMLRSYRNLCAYEFADIYAGIKSYQSSQNLYYALDASAYALYVSSYRLLLSGFLHPGLNGPPSIVGAVGSCFFAGNYPRTALAAKLLYKRYFQKFSKELGGDVHDAREEASQKISTLENLSSELPAETLLALGHLPQRVPVYKLWVQRFEEFVDKQTQYMRRMDNVALQNQVTGPALGSAYIAQDVLDMLCFYRFNQDPRMSQRLAAAGCMSGAAASGASLLLTCQGFIQDSLYLRKLNKQKAGPEDLIHQRIKTLNELEDRLQDKKK